jgi:hypothetical protein
VTPIGIALVAQIREEGQSGPPEGVPASGFMLLADRESGRSLAITLFETEDDLRKGDETLNAMNPPGGGMGTRISLEMYEVAVRFES